MINGDQTSPGPDDGGRRSPASRTETTAAFGGRLAVVLAFGVAFGYVEAAVVAYLQGALGLASGRLFPLQEASGDAGHLVAIEAGRELATLVMLAAVGWLAGEGRWERLAWTAVAFGAWDIAYYGWLVVFIGWPPSLATWDVLFLVPAPWVGPVWAPISVSLALIGVGAAAARRLRAGGSLRIAGRQVVAGLAGGALVIGSFLLGAPTAIAGETPEDFPWVVFAAGMLFAVAAAWTAFRSPAAARG